MRSHKRQGFTLIEVLVALAIASGALVLLLMACQASLGRSMRASLGASVQEAAESKLDEIRSGSEMSSRGDLAGHAGWVWVLGREPATMAELRGLERITLKVYAPQGSQSFGAWSVVAPAHSKRGESQ